MRIHIIGDNETASMLRGLLLRDLSTKVAVADSTEKPEISTQVPRLLVYIEEASTEDLVVDGVDSELERLIITNIAELTPQRIILQRAGGIQSDLEIRLVIPMNLREPVSLGVFRGIAQFFSQPTSQKDSPVFSREAEISDEARYNRAARAVEHMLQLHAAHQEDLAANKAALANAVAEFKEDHEALVADRKEIAGIQSTHALDLAADIRVLTNKIAEVSKILSDNQAVLSEKQKQSDERLTQFIDFIETSFKTKRGFWKKLAALFVAPLILCGVLFGQPAQTQDVNIRRIGGTAVTAGQINVNCVSGCTGGAGGGTSSNFNAAWPAAGTAVGFFDGTNMQGARVADLDTGAGTFYGLLSNLVRRSSGGPVELIGQATMANSLPVVIASDQSTVPVSAASLPLPTGASTLAEQQTQTTALQLIDDAIATTGAAIPSKGIAVSGTDGTNARVIKTDTSGEAQVDVLTLPTVTIGTFPDNEPINLAQVGGTAISGANVVDAGNTAFRVNCVTGCTPGGSFADDSTFTAGTSAVSPLAGVFNDSLSDVTSGNAAAPRITADRGLHVNLRNNTGTEIGTSGAPVRVDPTGTTTQPVSGTVTANQGGTWNINNVAGTVSLPTGASTLAEQQTQTTALQLVDDIVHAMNAAFGKSAAIGGQLDDVSITAATENNIAPVRITAQRAFHTNLRNDSGTEVGTSGAPLRTDPTGTTTQPVSGTVSAAQSGTWNITNVSGTVSLPTGASTLAEQQTQTTALQLLDDTVATTGSAITAKGIAISGTDGTNARVLKTDTSGEAQVDVLTLPSVTIGTFPDNEPINVAQMNGVTVTMGNGVSGTGVQRVTIASDSTGQVAVASFPDNEPINVAQMNGVAVTMGNGTVGTGVQRVAAASDNSAIANWGHGATGSAPPSGGTQVIGPTSGATGGLSGAVTVCTEYANIDQTSGEQIITGVSGRRVYICSLNLTVSAAQNVALVAGTGTVCATSTVPVPGTSGGSTAATGWNLAANSGIVLGGGIGAIAKTTVNADNVCLLQSGSAQVSGGISYAIY